MQSNQIDADLQRLERLGQMVTELSAEMNPRKLSGKILSSALELTGADGGALYLKPSPGFLCCEAVIITSADLIMSDGDLADTLPIVAIPEERLSGESLLVKTYLENRPQRIEIIRRDTDEFPNQHPFDKVFNYQTRSLLSVPVGHLPGVAHGVMLLMNPQSGLFTEQDQQFCSLLAASAGTTLWKNQQIEEQKGLFEATIQMVAGAVDEKFYLGEDHCRRVPVLTMMLARAVNMSSEAPFAGQIFSQQDLYQLEVAAWLHECGKLVTPISLFEKSHKLETVLDRLDLINTRFEIIRRDVEIARLRAGLEGDELPVLAEGQNSSQQMLEDLHFLSDCNHGKRRMTQPDLQKIQHIANSYRWIDRQMEEVSVLTEDEVANLSIESGTLNDREKVKINNHVLATIGMLDLLPFPESLQQVPDIIGGYCENLDGQPLLESRILAIADIFVSVMAENRPYRESNSLEEAIEILFGMRDAGQLDADLLDLFVRERLHQQYAGEFSSADETVISPSN